MSCVTGQNLDFLLKFLNVLPPICSGNEREKIMQELAELQVSWIIVVLLRLYTFVWLTIKQIELNKKNYDLKQWWPTHGPQAIICGPRTIIERDD